MSTSVYSHVRTFGRGERHALAIHCTLAHSGAWRGLGGALQDHLTLTAFDLPGHGKSDDWDGKTDLHGLCTVAALRHLTAPMDVIGHSFGATVALRLAVEQPQLVRSLTLIEPVFFAAAMRDAPEIAAAHEAEAEPYLGALMRGDTAQAARLFNRFWGDGTKWDDVPKTTRQYLINRMHIVLGQTPAITEDNAKIMVALSRAMMPALLIQGDRAVDVIDAIHASLAARLPHARRAWIKGAGHMSPVTHPDQVAAEVIKLLEMAEE